ncbi:11934_t:CDS:1, partial [Racocetra persica]
KRKKMATEVPDNFKPKFRVSFGPIATNTVEIKWGDSFEKVKSKIEADLNITVNRIASIRYIQPGGRFSENFEPEEFERTVFIVNP